MDFEGKRSEEKGDAGVRSGEGVMVRRPRYPRYPGYNEEDLQDYDDSDIYDDNYEPWAFIDLEAQIQNGLM